MISLKPTALVLFGGGGGSTLGLERAGFETVSVDNEQWCVDTLDAQGFPYILANLSRPGGRRMVRDIWNTVHEGERPDTFWTSPPCQPFSKARQAKLEDAPLDERADGFVWSLAIVRMLKPRSVVVENVTGAPFAEWAQVLRRWYPHVIVRTINAADHGVPQSLERRFLVATEEAPVSLAHVPTRHMTLGEALPWVSELVRSPSHARHVPPTHRLPIAPVKVPPRIVIFPYGIGGNKPQLLDRPAPTVTCQEVRGTRASSASNWHYNGGPDRLSDALFSAVRVRRATVQDCLIIQGMPADYKLVGTVEQQYKMVGNMVPPAVAEFIGTRVREVLDGE